MKDFDPDNYCTYRSARRVNCPGRLCPHCYGLEDRLKAARELIPERFVHSGYKAPDNVPTHPISPQLEGEELERARRELDHQLLFTHTLAYDYRTAPWKWLKTKTQDAWAYMYWQLANPSICLPVYFFGALLLIIAVVLLAIATGDRSAPASYGSLPLPPSNTTDTSRPPVTTFSFPGFPKFDCTPMSSAECGKMALLLIPNCLGSSVVNMTVDIGNIRSLPTEVQAVGMDRAVILHMFDDILAIYDEPTGDFKDVINLPEAFLPIRLSVVELTLIRCHHRCTSRLPALDFANLLLFDIQKCDYSYNLPLVIHRRDFANNNRLRAFVITACAFVDLEADAFADLPDIQLLWPTNNIHKDLAGLRLRSDQLWRYDCGPEYAWLQTMVRTNPNLTASKKTGSVYEVCESVSREKRTEDSLVPVEC